MSKLLSNGAIIRCQNPKHQKSSLHLYWLPTPHVSKVTYKRTNILNDVSHAISVPHKHFALYQSNEASCNDHFSNEICGLLGYYKVYGGNSLLMFRHNQRGQYVWPLKTELIGCPKISVRKHHYTLCNIPEEQRSHILHGGSLKSCAFHKHTQWMVVERKGTGYVTCENIRLVLLVQRHVFSYKGHDYFKIHSE